MAKKLSPTAFTKAVMRSFMADSGLEPSNPPAKPNKVQLRIVSAQPGRVDFELDIHKDHTNRLSTLHGGTLASLVDLGGSLAVASTGRFATGVSTDLNVTYLAPGGKPGDLLRGTATCDKIGKTLAFTTVTFTNGKGQLAARGSHTKYVAGTMGPDGPYVAPPEFSEDVD
ncbi:Thioesterase superfamily, partial [Metarhizium brunneum ARSEF 3297]